MSGSFFGLLFVPGIRKPAGKVLYKALQPRLLTATNDWGVWFTL
jgi:hypothetical protein